MVRADRLDPVDQEHRVARGPLRGLGDRIESVDVIAGEMHEQMLDEAEFYDFLATQGFETVQKRRFDSSADDAVHMFEVRRPPH